MDDHLERFAGKAGQEVTEYLFFQTYLPFKYLPISRRLYINISEVYGEFSVEREEGGPG